MNESMCAQACEVIKNTGSFIRNESVKFNRDAVEEKSFNQLVSYVDKESENMLVKGLQKLLPEAGFITEEATIATEKKEWMWVIDPLDGTTNFIHGLPVYSISVGLMQHDEIRMGIVYEINRDEMFYAWSGSEAFLNGHKIQVKSNADLSQSLLATGFPYYDFDLMQKYLSTLHYFMKNTQGMRRLGSAAVDLAYVACGRFDGFFEYGLHPWDVCGGAFIVQQAGGKVTDFKLDNNFVFGKEIIAGSGAIHEPFSKIIAEQFS
jgi:myo-inositol-1(or 4)-monophosphatase